MPYVNVNSILHHRPTFAGLHFDMPLIKRILIDWFIMGSKKQT